MLVVIDIKVKDWGNYGQEETSWIWDKNSMLKNLSGIEEDNELMRVCGGGSDDRKR